MKKLLITSFEPFGGMEFNSSMMVLENLKSSCNGIQVVKKVLPVIYKKAFNILKECIESEKPDVVICMGQAGGRAKVSIERIAVNINSGRITDNDGVLKKDEIIIENGAGAYFTNLPHRDMQKEADDSILISYSAGTFICNDIFYRLMHWIQSENLHIKCGFLHLPYTEHFGKMPYMDLQTQIATVEAMLAVTGVNDEN